MIQINEYNDILAERDKVKPPHRISFGIHKDVKGRDPFASYYCIVCKSCVAFYHNFCPHCGQRLKEDVCIEIKYPEGATEEDKRKALDFILNHIKKLLKTDV